MEGLAMGIGMLLAILGPLMLLPAIWLVYRFVGWPLWRRVMEPGDSPWAGRLGALAASGLLVLCSVGASYAWGKVEFDRLCALQGTPDIDRVVRVDGYFQNPLFPYQARQILEEGPFGFVEGPNDRNEMFKRYTLDDQGELEEVEVSELSSEYGMRETFDMARGGTTVMERVIYEIGSAPPASEVPPAPGVRLARAASLTYGGGPLSLFLGVYGMASCPDVRSSDGSEHFQQFYELPAIVLGGG